MRSGDASPEVSNVGLRGLRGLRVGAVGRTDAISSSTTVETSLGESWTFKESQVNTEKGLGSGAQMIARFGLSTSREWSCLAARREETIWGLLAVAEEIEAN